MTIYDTPNKLEPFVAQAQEAAINYQQTQEVSYLDTAIAAWQSVFSHPEFEKSQIDFRTAALSHVGQIYLYRYYENNQLPDFENGLNLLQTALKQAPADFPDLSIILHSLGHGLQVHYQYTQNREILKQTIELFSQAVSETPSNSPYQPLYLNYLASAYRANYTQTGDIQQLKQANQYWETALQIMQDDSPYQVPILNNLAEGLCDHYAQSGQLDDLERAITVYEQALSKNEVSEVNQSILMSNLAMALCDRYDQNGKLNDLNQAIEILETILLKEDVSSENRAHRLNSLGKALLDRYENGGKENDLEWGIECYEQALKLLTSDSPKYTNGLNGLGLAWRARYKMTGNSDDLLQAIQTLEKAIADTPTDSPQLPHRLHNLGLVLHDRYLLSGDVSDLEATLALCRQAVEKAPRHAPDTLVMMDNLSEFLRQHYVLDKNLKDLQQAIQIQQQVLAETGKNSPHRANCLSGLGINLSERYRNTGNPNDLNQAIEACRQAVRLCPDNATDYPSLLNNLGSILCDYYTSFGDLNILDETIDAWQRAVEKSSPNAFDRMAWQNNLAISLHHRYKRTGTLADLNQAIEIWQYVVNHTPTHAPDRSDWLNNLAMGLRERYLHQEDKEDLTQAIQFCENALENNSDDLELLNSLAILLQERYKAERQWDDINEAITLLERVVKLTPPHSPEHPKMLHNLAGGLLRRYQHHGETFDQQRAFSMYQQAAQEGLEIAAEIALYSAINWGNWAFSQQNWDQVIQAYHYTHQASERLLQRQLLRRTRETWLRDIQDISGQAAYAFVQQNDLPNAVLALERGTAQLLAGVLKRDYAELQALQKSYPDLYQRYQQANRQLAQLENEKSFQQSTTFDPLTEVRTARTELETVIADIQQIAGYEHFFEFLSISEIQSALTNSSEALVYITTTTAGTIILIVTIQGIQSLNLTFDTVDFVQLLTDKTIEPKELLALGKAVKTDDFNNFSVEKAVKLVSNSYFATQLLDFETFEENLGKHLSDSGQRLIGPLADKLRKMNLQKLSLVPIGLFSLFPLHAACYPKAQQTVYFCEEFIVTYVPNALALVTARREHQKRQHQYANLLGLANTRPHSQPLAAAPVELKTIASLFAKESGYLLEGPKATYNALIKQLPTAVYLHFACHGLYNVEDSLASHLQLSGQQTFSLAELIFGKAQPLQARLVVLSACKTGLIHFRNVPDESIGFPAGFLQAGVPGVISTLWSVDDISTALLMIRFYQYHLQEKLEPSQALQQAQTWLRNATGKQLGDFGRQFFQKAAQKEPYVYQTMRHFNAISEKKPFAHPYYWAGFVFSGV